MTDWGGVGGGVGGRNRVRLWEELKVPKNKPDWASQDVCIQFQVNQEMFLSVYSTPSVVRGQCCPGPGWFPSPSKVIQGGCLRASSHLPSFVPSTPTFKPGSGHPSYSSGVPHFSSFSPYPPL